MALQSWQVYPVSTPADRPDMELLDLIRQRGKEKKIRHVRIVGISNTVDFGEP